MSYVELCAEGDKWCWWMVGGLSFQLLGGGERA